MEKSRIFQPQPYRQVRQWRYCFNCWRSYAKKNTPRTLQDDLRSSYVRAMQSIDPRRRALVHRIESRSEAADSEPPPAGRGKPQSLKGYNGIHSPGRHARSWERIGQISRRLELMILSRGDLS